MNLRMIRDSMQEYVDERSSGELELSDTKVAELFNDFLLYLEQTSSIPTGAAYEPVSSGLEHLV